MEELNRHTWAACIVKATFLPPMEELNAGPSSVSTNYNVFLPPMEELNLTLRPLSEEYLALSTSYGGTERNFLIPLITG